MLYLTGKVCGSQNMTDKKRKKQEREYGRNEPE